MRLIDADAFSERMENDTDICAEMEKHGLAALRKYLDIHPTTYVVDKVAYQLDKASDRYECEEQGRELVQLIDLSEALKIVKSGGIE